MIVKAIVAHYFELVENTHLRVLAQAMRLVIDFFDIRFRTGRLDDTRAVRFDLLKAFLAHAFGQDDDAIESHPTADVRATDSIIAGAGPYERVFFRIDFSE